jgi:hypothetical protein
MIKQFYSIDTQLRRYDTNHNDTQHNDIQHKGLVYDTPLLDTLDYAECCYAKSRVLFTVMLSVIMLNVVMLSAVVPSAYPIPSVKKTYRFLPSFWKLWKKSRVFFPGKDCQSSLIFARMYVAYLSGIPYFCSIRRSFSQILD